jgi:DNA-binding transcriptional MerR regulator
MSSQEDKPTIIRADHIELRRSFYRTRDVCRMFGLTSRAIRFYCEAELITPCVNDGERLFDKRNVRRLALVKIGIELGFSLREIGQMLRNSENDCTEAHLELSAKRIEEEILFVNGQRTVMAERLRWLVAYKRHSESLTADQAKVA